MEGNKQKKKILFLQEFSMNRQGGGVSIIKRLISAGPLFNCEEKIAYDRTANKAIVGNTNAQVSFYSLPRNIRFGIGKMLGRITLFSLDIGCFLSLVRLIRKENPDIIHITAHGVCLPLMVKAARFNRKQIVMSVHDLWFFSVNSYIPKTTAHQLFAKLISYASTVYVISPEMGHYLKKEYGEKNYQVIHDGVAVGSSAAGLLPTGNHLRFLYVGLLHSMQVDLFKELLEVMGSFSGHDFTIGICSSNEYNPPQDYSNITIKNYGWLAEEKIKDISREYSYGLLPLSFDPADELFYRTSLMTKIPFYTGVGLPIICIGPKSASAVQLIQQQHTGITSVSGKQEDISEMINQILALTPDAYQLYVHNLKLSAATTFNIDLITESFYRNLFQPAQDSELATTYKYFEKDI